MTMVSKTYTVKRDNRTNQVSLDSLEYMDVAHMFAAAYGMPKNPNRTRLPDNWITDEDMSVKWNRDQVTLDHKKWDEEAKRLREKRNKKIQEAKEATLDYIQFNVGHNICRETAEDIYNKAYEDGHAYGYSEVMIHVAELCPFVADILEREVVAK